MCCISGFVDYVMFSQYGCNGGVSLPQQRRTRANAPAAWYWLKSVLDDGAAAKTRRDLGLQDDGSEYSDVEY